MIDKYILVLSFFLQFLFGNYVGYGAELFIDGENARNLGMGGFSQDFSINLNPAKLTRLTEASIEFSYKDKFSGLANVYTLSYFNTYLINKYHFPIYIGLINRVVDKIPDTRRISNIYNPIDYSKIEYFSQNEIGFILATGIKIQKIKFGLAIKPNYTRLLNYYALGISGDFGMYSSFPHDKLQFGLKVENFFSLNYWNTKTIEQNYPSIILDGYFKLKSLFLGIELGTNNIDRSKINYHLGVEYRSNIENIVFRVGGSHRSLYNLGIGFIGEYFNIDYAYVQSSLPGPFSVTQIFSIKLHINKWDRFKNNNFLNIFEINNKKY